MVGRPAGLPFPEAVATGVTQSAVAAPPPEGSVYVPSGAPAQAQSLTPLRKSAARRAGVNTPQDPIL